MRKAVNLLNFAKREAVLVSEINALSERVPVILKIGLLVISLLINRRAFCDHLMDVYITLTI